MKEAVPNQSANIHPRLAEYARWSRKARTRGLLLLGLISAGLVAAYFVLPEDYILAEHRLWFLLLSIIPSVVFVYILIWRRNHLHVFNRLSWVLENVVPVNAEVMIERKGATTKNKAYFIHIYKLMREPPWRIGEKLRLVWPRGQNEELIENQRRWASIYFDPEYEGNAVYLIEDNLFVSVGQMPIWG